MADVKISALPSATTPLAGTEVLPIVQSATTDQVSVANLTAGRSVSAASLTLTTTPLAAGSGGTAQSSYAIGDILYASGTTALSKLADVATGNALISGGVGVAPSWGKIGLTTHVSGTLPIANGGTNATTFTTNQVNYFNGTSIVGSANLTFNGTTLTAANDATINTARVGLGNNAISSNLAFGASALNSNTTGAFNVAVGYQALNNNLTGQYNTAVGYQALTSNNTGQLNVGLGQAALQSNTSGSNNLAMGAGAAYFNQTGGSNVAVGAYSCGFGNMALANFSGVVGVGASVLYNNTASNITAIGTSALQSNTTGVQNTAVGLQAGYYNATGTQNTALGYQALFGVSGNNHSSNTGIGNLALTAVTTGSSNTAVGNSAGNTNTTGASNVFIGDSTTGSSATTTNEIVIGTSIAGFGASRLTFGSSGNRIYSSTFSTATVTWTQTSDERTKTEIKDEYLGLDFINEIRPVTFKWKPSYDIPKELYTLYNETNEKDTEVLNHGLIAQNVKAALDKYGDTSFTGWDIAEDGSQSVGVGAFVLPLIKAVQELSAQVEELKKRVK